VALVLLTTPRRTLRALSTRRKIDNAFNGAYATTDKPFKYRTSTPLVATAQLYNNSTSLTQLNFWRYGVGMAIVDGALVYFFCYYSIAAKGQNSVDDLYSLGKLAYVALLGVVTLEVS
jgi:hypothetical protein